VPWRNHGKPKRISIDNGPGSTPATTCTCGHEKHQIDLQFTQPGKPTQNSYIERFNRTYRTEVLDGYLFSSIQEVLTTTEKFQHNYNHNRPHGSLNDLPPVAFKEHRNNYKHQSKDNLAEKAKNANLV
jgi:putative transposase